jgi:hypothetical protein
MIDTACFLGYGYEVNIYSDSPYDYYDEEARHKQWLKLLDESSYWHSLGSDSEIGFFGINISELAVPGEIIDLEVNNDYGEWREWNICNAEFYALFPSLRRKPHLKLVCMDWR